MYKKPRKAFDINSPEPFMISRSKVDLFVECPRCFYFDRRRGVMRPSIPAFTLNNAVDRLMKKEFDLLRVNGQVHELVKQYKINAVPFRHQELATWRDDGRTYTGAFALHEDTNLIISGIIDDMWQDKDGKLIVVDYKATSTSKVISLEDRWKQGYKRQLEIYQWIFRKKGFDVSDIGYFIFANAGYNRPKFDGRLEFELSIIPHKGDTTWIEPTLDNIKKCLLQDNPPKAAPECEYCAYVAAINHSDTVQLSF